MPNGNHPPDCRCESCQLARDGKVCRCAVCQTWRSLHPINPAPPLPSEPRNGILPPAWTDAIAAAIQLGVKRPAAERRAVTLAVQHPRASTDKALRLLLGSE